MAKYITINLKSRLQPMYRHNLEDMFDEYCQENNIAVETSGGGTSISDDGEPLECDIELQGSNGLDIAEKDLKAVQDYFHKIAPKGSSVIIYPDDWADNDDAEPERIDIGLKEGLALHINGTELDDEVYENNDINTVVDSCVELLGELGNFESYWEGENTVLYFYGDNFNTMRTAIEPFLKEYPLCQKCKVEQVA